MKRLLLLLLLTFSINISLSQPPQFFVDTWYLHSLSFNNGETFINTLGITDGPTLTLRNDSTLSGHSFCNNFSGDFEYISHWPFGVHDELKLRNIVSEIYSCGNLQNLEDHFLLPFIEGRTAEIYVIGNQPDAKHIVFQFYDYGYQVYKNYSALSLPESSLKDFLVFPNPVEHTLIINSEVVGFERISITDINGRIVMDFSNKPSNEVDVSSLKSGMYFIRIESSSGNITKKFIKN